MHSDGITRRSFLELTAAAGVSAVAGRLGGCAYPVRMRPHPGFAKLPYAKEEGKAVLGVFGNRDPKRIIRQVVKQVSDMRWLARGDSVFIKVACNSPNPHPAVTSPRAVEALTAFLKERGAGRVYVGDQAGVGHVRLTKTGRKNATRTAMAKNGLLAAANKAGAVPHLFDEHGWNGYFRPKEDFPNHWQGRLYLADIIRKVDHIVYLNRLSSHVLAGYTCAVKNAVGWIRDDSRMVLHQKGACFFEKIAEINHFEPIRSRLRLNLTLGTRALTNLGPDFGEVYDFKGWMALASTRLVDHDSLAKAVLLWLDRKNGSVFDLYSPYPQHINFFNHRFVKHTWGTRAAARYVPIAAYDLEKPLAHDSLLAHLAWLQRYRPRNVEVTAMGYHFPRGLVSHLRRVNERFFVLASGC